MSAAEAAAHWVVLEDAGPLTDRERDEFERWCENPLHADAYRRASDTLSLFDGAQDRNANLRALRQSALEVGATPPARYRLVAGAAIAASVAATLAFVGLERMNSLPGKPHVATTSTAASATAAHAGRAPAKLAEYRTGVGQRRTVTLVDGSVVTMNTQTKLTVWFSAHRRIIRLSRGQALFEVTHNPSRPFSVEAADRQVTALGTVFEVRLDPGRVKVVLIRGRVVVDRTAETAGTYDEARIPPIILKPGQQFDAELGAPQTVVSIDIDRQLLWRSGFVEFDDEPLGRAVAEINRYASHPIILDNDGVAMLRVSGIYRTGTPEQFIDAIQSLLPVDARPTTQGEIELSLAARPAS